MEDLDIPKFSWTGLFFVTGACFLAFSLILKLLDGNHVSLFLIIGLVNLGCGVLALINERLNRKEANKENPEPVSPLFQE